MHQVGDTVSFQGKVIGAYEDGGVAYVRVTADEGATSVLIPAAQVTLVAAAEPGTAAEGGTD